MPTPATAQLVRGHGDLGDPPSVTQNSTGYRGVAYWWANTAEEFRALNAANMPQWGDSWHPVDAPELRCISRQTKYVGGTDDTVTGVNAVTSVECVYETPGYNGRLPLPALNLSFTDLQYEEITLTQHYDIRGYTTPLNNGEGVPRESTRMIAEAYRYVRPGAIDLAQIFGVLDKLNSTPFHLPPEPGSNVRQLVPALNARMRAPRRQLKGGLIEIVYRMVLSPDHKVYAQIENSRGVAIMTQIIEQYSAVDFNPLFP